MPEPRLFENDFIAEVDTDDDLAASAASSNHTSPYFIPGLAVGAVVLVLAVMLILGRSFGNGSSVAVPGEEVIRSRPGAEVVPDGRPVGNVAVPGSGWADVRERLADQSIVPTRTPLGFYLVLFVVVAAAVLLFCLVIKVLRSTAFWTAVFVALLIVVLHAWHTGKLDDVERWGRESPKETEVLRH